MARTRQLVFALATMALLTVWVAPPVLADGTETLGTPSVTLAAGSGIAVAGAGMFEQPASFPVSVPEGATVNQVLLYWEAGHRHGDTSGDEPDSSIRINGIDVNADMRIGGETFFYGSPAGDVFTATHRTDITGLGLVGAGTTILTVDGLDIDEVDDGAGVVVIYSEADTPDAELSLVDGNDVAFVNFDAPLDSTVTQTFSFTPAEVERTAKLTMIVSSIHDPVPGCSCRPNFMEYTVAGQTTRIPDPFPDTEGREFDTGTFDVTVPAGASEVSVQMLSEFIDGDPNLPASLVWLVAGLAIAPTQPPESTTTTSTSIAASTLPTTGPSTPSTPWLFAAFAMVGIGAMTLVAGRLRTHEQ